ncbi:MAG: hypothetical protein HYY16_17890 [Planctomycetes bacterium]|nr:hypothetical protein [Planctomycetota bacterium]
MSPNKKIAFIAAAALVAAALIAGVLSLALRKELETPPNPPPVASSKEIPVPKKGTGSIHGRLRPEGLDGQALIVWGTKLLRGSGIDEEGTFLLRDLPPRDYRVNYHLTWKGKEYFVEVHEADVPVGALSPSTKEKIGAILTASQAEFRTGDAKAVLRHYSERYDSTLGTPMETLRAFTEEAVGAKLSREALLMDVAGTDERPAAAVKYTFRFHHPEDGDVVRTNDFIVFFAREGEDYRIIGERKLYTGALTTLGTDVETRVAVSRRYAIMPVVEGEIYRLGELDLTELLNGRPL